MGQLFNSAVMHKSNHKHYAYEQAQSSYKALFTKTGNVPASLVCFPTPTL